ncbi:MAG: DUF6455 family protein [Paracoccaceae bacterium]
MFGLEKLEKHERLVTGMGDALGVDLMEEVQRGNLAPEELRSRVFRCMGCTDPEACGHMLAQNKGEKLEATPAYCRNSEMFDALTR